MAATVIYPVDNGYIISSGGVWLPGVYASERAARYAFRFSYDDLVRIHASRGGAGTYRPITVECLHEWRYTSGRPDSNRRPLAPQTSALIPN